MGLQYLIKNKIAPNPFVEMLFARDVVFAMADVRDVSKSIFQAATRMGLYDKNYLIASESYAVYDISRMLNQQAPLWVQPLCMIVGWQKKSLAWHLFQPGKH